MTARADEAERRLAAIELRLEGIDSFIADARRWLVDSLVAGERERPLTTSEAEARDRLLKAAEHSAASVVADAIVPPSYGDQESVELASLAAWVNWVAMAFDLSERWPSCWYRHEGLVFEMQSLRRWHVALRTDLATDPSSAIRWSEALHRVNTESARHIAQRCLSTHRRRATPRLGRGLDLPATVPQTNREHDHAATDATSTLESSRIVNAAIGGSISKSRKPRAGRGTSGHRVFKCARGEGTARHP